MSRFTTALNLYADGYERVASGFKRSMLRHVPRKSLVISPSGRVIYFHNDEPIPEKLQPGLIGVFTRECPANVIEDALIHHMKERQK